MKREYGSNGNNGTDGRFSAGVSPASVCSVISVCSVFSLDNLLASGKIKPFIVVMPFGYGVTPGGPQTENTAKFGKDLIEDVIPYIEANYRAFTDRDRRAIAGLSMGGGQALSIELNNLDIFSYVAGFSSGLGNAANFPKTYASLIGQRETANRKIRMCS